MFNPIATVWEPETIIKDQQVKSLKNQDVVWYDCKLDKFSPRTKMAQNLTAIGYPRGFSQE